MSHDKSITAQGGSGGVFGVNGGRGAQGDIAIDGAVYTSDHPQYEQMRQQAIHAMAKRIQTGFGGNR
jgi:hypothetical protein